MGNYFSFRTMNTLVDFEIKFLKSKDYSLGVHITIVHDENLSNVRFVIKYLKLFKCEICDKIFEKKSKLRKHITIVHDENLSNNLPSSLSRPL